MTVSPGADDGGGAALSGFSRPRPRLRSGAGPTLAGSVSSPPPKGTAMTILAIALTNVLAGSAIITGLALLMRNAARWGSAVEA